MSVKVKMLGMVILPVVLLGVVSCLLAAISIRNGMEDEVLNGLKAASKMYRDIKLTDGDQFEENTLEDKLKNDTFGEW